MPMVKYRDDNRAAARIQARLRGDCPDDSDRQNFYMKADEGAEANPTRCITTVYYGATAHGGVRNPVYKGNGDY